MELGNKIVEIRKRNNLTQEEFAEICSVTRQTISNWENSKSYPDLETLVLISDTFNVSLDEMLKGDRKMVSSITKEQKQGKGSKRKITIAIVFAIAIALISILYVEANTRESYIPYAESGIIVSDNGDLCTEKNYSCMYGYCYETETVNGECHCVEFIYLTDNFYSKYIDKKTNSQIPFANYSQTAGTVLGEDGTMIDSVVTEVYYLPKEYIDSQKLLNNKHAQLIKMGTSEQEKQLTVQQMKDSAILLWKRE